MAGKGTAKEGKLRRAVFLDRDGTINADKYDWVYRVEDFRFLPPSIEAMKRLAGSDYVIIIVTNQSGVAHGVYTEEDIQKVHRHLVEELRKHGVGIHKLYYCPHHPDGKVKDYSFVCECRKPGVKLYREAAEEFGIDCSKSWAIGDKERDVVPGKMLGCKTILVKSGYEDEGYYSDKQADHIVGDLLDAVNIILEGGKND